MSIAQSSAIDKSPIYTCSELRALERALHKRVLYQKSPLSKESSIHPTQPAILSSKSYTQETNIKEPYIRPKEPYIHSKEP